MTTKVNQLAVVLKDKKD
jgi:hypothetical protein